MANLVGAGEGAIAAAGVAALAVVGWRVLGRRRGGTFAIAEAVATQLPWSAPTRTVLTVTLDRPHADVRPAITVLGIVDAERRARPEFTFAGPTEADDDDTVTVEVLRDGQPGVFDLDGLYIEVTAGHSGGGRAEIRVVDPG
jgi:hypothetical protein